MRELLADGHRERASREALGEVYGELDERTLIDEALRKKLRGRTS
jgi:hypothetical protein